MVKTLSSGAILSSVNFTVAFQTDKPLADYAALGARAEEWGFDGVSVYNDLLFQPAWPALLEIAKATHRVRIGPAAVNPFTCHPVNIAGHIALVDQVSQGRAYLGLARGGWLEYLGLRPERPILALAEAFECVRRLLSGDRRPFPGQFFPLAGGDGLRWEGVRGDIPFLLGSWGAKTIDACVGHVEEVKLGGTANPEVVSATARRIAESTSRVGKGPSSVRLVVGSVTVVDGDAERARLLARREVALYLPVVARLDPALKLEEERLQRIEEAAAQKDWDAAAALIPDDLLRRTALAGDPSGIVDQTLELLAAGADRVEFGTPHGFDETEGLRLLGQHVLPALHANARKS